jgi:hypothetical protein
MLSVGNTTETRGSLRKRLLILHWISHDAVAHAFGEQDALTEARESLPCVEASKSLVQVP